MGRVITNETPQTTTPTLPIECAEGHRIYVVYFPTLYNYGFSCPECHHLGVTAQDRKIILEVVCINRKLKALSGDLLLYSTMKGQNVTCPKSHQVSPMSIGQCPDLPQGGYGFMEEHCKLYSVEIMHNENVLVIRQKNEQAGKEHLGLIVH